MSAGANWFARKLGGAPPQAPQAPVGTPVQHPYTNAPQAPPAPQAAPQPAQPVDPNNVEPGGPGSFTHALQEAIRTGQTQGGDAHKRKRVGTCPECGSGNYFMIRNGPSCFDCGYPKLQGPDAGAMPPAGMAEGWESM